MVQSGAIAAEIDADFVPKPGCGLSEPVRLTAIRLGDGRMAALKPAAILRCETVLAVAAWVREDIAPAVAALGTKVEAVKVAASYDCRSRNRVFGARMSEHGYGNALDVGGFEVADRRKLEVEGGGFPLSLRNLMKDSACRRFSTVLGPGSDGYHEDHIHVDIAQRRNDFKLCRWETADKPKVAAPVPQPKPADGAQSPAAPSAQGQAAVAPVDGGNDAKVAREPATIAPSPAKDAAGEGAAGSPAKGQAGARPGGGKSQAAPATGAKSTGAKSTGAKSSGAKSSGAKSSGAKSSGAEPATGAKPPAGTSSEGKSGGGKTGGDKSG
ncbi:extensin family protein [Xanthobacter pseudotagetidis]|uniref:extensin family protein n=1 Tax=Xanthobacter pseudotagetidis TaxID=3119911 RepID=UPI0037280001